MVSPIKNDSIFPSNLIRRRNLPPLKIKAKEIQQYFKEIDPYYIYSYHAFSPRAIQQMLNLEVIKMRKFMQDRKKKWLEK